MGLHELQYKKLLSELKFKNEELEIMDESMYDIHVEFEKYYSDSPEDFCNNLDNNWIYWLNVDDYDNDGNLDISNKMMTNRPLHRWEWNGSKYVKLD